MASEPLFCIHFALITLKKEWSYFSSSTDYGLNYQLSLIGNKSKRSTTQNSREINGELLQFSSQDQGNISLQILKRKGTCEEKWLLTLWRKMKKDPGPKKIPIRKIIIPITEEISLLPQNHIWNQFIFQPSSDVGLKHPGNRTH